MKDAKDLIPWKVTDISLRPYEGFWSFNPSILFDGKQWICVLRCCDYAMPSGVTIRSKGARSTGQQTKNAMVILDPTSWKPIRVYKMHELDGLPRAATPHVGYEDMRLFRTDKGGLQGIAASLHLKRETKAGPASEGAPRNQPPEQVIVSFDDEYNIVAAQPIRGAGWGGTPQKNWSPFDHCVEPRFLYSIGKGTMFGNQGAIHDDVAIVRSSAITRPLPSASVVAAPVELPLAHAPVAREESRSHPRPSPPSAHPDPRTRLRGGSSVQMVRGGRGGRAQFDALTSRPSLSRAGRQAARVDGSVRVMTGGRSLVPKYEGLRGGTQLVRVGESAWLGIGHEMKFVNGKKYYWHTWYVVDDRGKMTSVSAPMKFVTNGIEFAAGMSIDGDRVVVSFGVDDMECKIGETRLSAVLGILRPINKP